MPSPGSIASVSKNTKRADEQHEGRVTKKASPGRYTPATPNSTKVSPKWYGPVILALFLIGVVVILCNYLSVFGSATGWGLLIGLLFIATGFGFATRYR